MSPSFVFFIVSFCERRLLKQYELPPSLLFLLSFSSVISVPQRRQGVVDPIEVRRKEVHPKAARDRQEPPAEAIQRQEEPSHHARPHRGATTAQTQTEPSHAASGHG